MDNLVITLYGENGQPLSYEVERIFGIEGTEQLYCAVFPANDSEGGVIFLRCSLERNGEDMKVTVFDIPNTAEYQRVMNAYEEARKQSMVDEVNEELTANYADYISVTDIDGNKVDFIIHTIFEDAERHRSYAAVQKVDKKTGEVNDEISLYRFSEENDTAILDMIPSDMEYVHARELFMNLIETT